MHSAVRTKLYIAALLAALPLAAQQRYSFTKFYVPPPPKTRPGTMAAGTNSSGTSVGYYSTRQNDLQFNKGFVRNPDGTLQYPISDPNDPNGQNTYFTGINDAGIACGYYFGTAADGFLYSNGNFTDISEIEGGNTQVLGINNNGDYAGTFGPSNDGPGIHGFISIGGTVTQVDVPGASATVIAGLADDGSSVGVASANGTGTNIAFVRSASGSIRTFQAKNAAPAGTAATGINSEAKLIVGYYYENSGAVHGFVFHYNGSLDDANALGASSQSASAAPARLNVMEVSTGESGSVYINGVNSNGVITGYWQPAPPLMAIGFIGTPIQ